MKVGIKKVHENEWSVHIGNAAVKLDHFSVALLNITLEHLLALEHGDEHSTLDSYISLGLRMKSLKPVDLQKFMQILNNKDVLNLMLVARDHELNDLVMENIGGILAKQFDADLASSTMPSEEEAKISIKNIVEKMFEQEAQGRLEVLSEDTRYI